MLNIFQIETKSLKLALSEGEDTAFRVKKQRSCLGLFTLLATLKVKPGKEADVTEICTQLAKEVLSKEKDCLMYIPHVVKNDPTEIVFFEKYKDKEAFKVHGDSAYFREAAQKFEDLLEGKIEVKFLEEV